MPIDKNEKISVPLSAEMIAEVFPVSTFIKEELEARKWTNEKFAEVMQCNLNTVTLLLADALIITPRLANNLSAAFGTGSEIWINLYATYQRRRNVTPKKG